MKLFYLLCCFFPPKSSYATSNHNGRSTRNSYVVLSKNMDQAFLFLWLTDFSFTYLQIKPVAESIQTCACWFFPLSQGDKHSNLRTLSTATTTHVPKAKSKQALQPIPLQSPACSIVSSFGCPEGGLMDGSNSCRSQIVTRVLSLLKRNFLNWVPDHRQWAYDPLNTEI